MPNGDVLAGGSFQTADGLPIKFLARWNGTAWSEFGGGIDGDPGIAPFVASLALLPNGELLVGGNIDTVAGAPLVGSIARWDGANWHDLDGGVDQFLQTLEVLPNGNVIAAGHFQHAGASAIEAANIALWDGSDWHALGLGVESNGGITDVEHLSNGDLIVTGAFTAAGRDGWQSNCVAYSMGKYNGSDRHAGLHRGWASLRRLLLARQHYARAGVGGE